MKQRSILCIFDLTGETLPPAPLQNMIKLLPPGNIVAIPAVGRLRYVVE